MKLIHLKIVFLFAQSLAALPLALPLAAQDLILSRTVWEAPSSASTIGDVVNNRGLLAVQSPKGAKGSETTVWMRLQVHAPAHGSEVVLYIVPSYINQIRLYEAGSGDPSTWKTRVTGNLLPYSLRDRASAALSFKVNLPNPEGTFYLRVDGALPTSFDVQALTPESAMDRDRQHDLLALFFVTSMTFLLLWAVHSYFLDRQKVVGLFAVFQMAYALFGIAVTGYMAPLNPARFPHFIDSLVTVLYLTVSFTSTFFCRELFRPYEPPQLIMRAMKALLFVPPLLLVVQLLGFQSEAVSLNALLTKITWALFLVTTFLLRKEQTPKRRSLQILFAGILLNMVSFWIVWDSSIKAGNVDAQLLNGFHHLIMDGLVMGALFALVLHTRTRQSVKEGQQSAMELLLVQERFMLEQELKHQIEIQAQTDYLTGINNRRHFVELAEKELARAIRFQRPFTLLVMDVDHFKRINDTWGHAVGDLVLQQIARVTNEAMRTQDHFGRTGGEEFAIVLVETEGSSAVEAAQRLCASQPGPPVHLQQRFPHECAPPAVSISRQSHASPGSPKPKRPVCRNSVRPGRLPATSGGSHSSASRRSPSTPISSPKRMHP